MDGTAEGATARDALLRELIDDAGLFPPASLPMAEVVAAHRRARTGPHGSLMGRFICPAARLEELWTAWSAGGAPGEPLRLCVVARPAPDGGRPGAASTSLEAIGAFARAAGGGARVETVEVPLPAGVVEAGGEAAVRAADAVAEAAAVGGVPSGATIHLEVPFPAGWRTSVPAALDALADLAAGTGERAVAAFAFGAKVRCGGLEAAAFPSPEQLAAFVGACARRRLRFKATAGLHRAIRHRDPATGFIRHGFLNLAVAAVLALRGTDDAVLAAVLADEDPGDVAPTPSGLPWRGETLRPDEIAAARAELFVSYGSCSFDEPVEDLAALGVLPPEGRR